MRKIALIISLCLAFAACSEDKVTNSSGEEAEWPDRTEKEDVIEIVMMVYNEDNDIEKYKEVLLKPDSQADKWPEGYIWRNQERDYLQYGETYDYEQDWKGTQGILTHAITIDMRIFSGEWSQIAEFRNESCDDCWETIRDYYFDIYFNDGNHFIGDYKIQFVIGPDRDDSSKYVIYQGADIPK